MVKESIRFRKLMEYVQLNESLLDAKEKNAKNMSDEEFAFVVSFDPLLHDQVNNLTPENMANMNESYVKWLIKMFKKGELKSDHREKIINILKMFDYNKKRRNVLPNNDIFAYKSFEDIESALSSIGDNLTVNQKNKDAKRNQQKLSGEKQPGVYLDGNVELLFNGNEWEIWKPLTFEGSKALRRGASWCTGGDTPNFYNRYTEQGTLYVIMRKKDNSEKYQLFAPNDGSGQPREFRDANNNELSFRELCHENPEMLDFFLTQPDVVDAYPNLDDPDEIDEDLWDENRDDEIWSTYDLAFDNNEELGVALDMDILCRDCKYTTPNQYIEMYNNKYVESLYDSEELKPEVIKTYRFIEELNWGSTKLATLYNMYKKETGNEESFDQFLEALFDTEDNGYDKFSDVSDWLGEKYSINTSDGDHHYLRDVYDCIDILCIQQLIEEDIYDNLCNGLGVGNTIGDNRADPDYEYIVLILNDVYSPRDLWELHIQPNHIHNKDEFYRYMNIRIREDIDPNNAEFEVYSNYIEDDAERILDLFISTKEYNDFIDDNDDENTTNLSLDDKLDEVFKIAGVQLNEGITDLQKYFPKMDLETIKKLVALDPTYKGGDQLGKYGRWILQLAYNNVKNDLASQQYKELLNQYPDGINPKNGQEFKAPKSLPAIKDEDLYKITPALKKYDLYKKEIGKPIDSFKTLPELNTVINNIEKSGLPSNDLALKRYQLFKKAKEKGLKVVFEDSKWIIGIPTTKESSCVFANDTHWCTTQQTYDYYEEYSKDGDLYINLNKSNGALYQFHYESSSYMDEDDNPISIGNLFRSNPELKNFYIKLWNINIDEVFNDPNTLKNIMKLKDIKIDDEYIEGMISFDELDDIYDSDTRDNLSLDSVRDILNYNMDSFNFNMSVSDTKFYSKKWDDYIEPLDISYQDIGRVIDSNGNSYDRSVFNHKQAEAIYEFAIGDSFEIGNIYNMIANCQAQGIYDEAYDDIMDQFANYLPVNKKMGAYDDLLPVKIQKEEAKDIIIDSLLKDVSFMEAWNEAHNDGEKFSISEPYYGWSGFNEDEWNEALQILAEKVKEIMSDEEYASSDDDEDDEYYDDYDDEYYDDLEEVLKIAGVKL